LPKRSRKLSPRTRRSGRAGLLTLEQAGELLGGTAVGTIRNWIWEGRIKGYKPGKHLLVRESELLAFVEAKESTAKRLASRRVARCATEAERLG
jgi:excisionase family DNA binding protein